MTIASALAFPRRAELPTVSGCALRPSPQAAGQARSFTRHTLTTWGMAELADDVVLVVTELLANAIRHAWPAGLDGSLDAGPGDGEAGPDAPGLGLWLLREADGCMCVVTDPSAAAPALRPPGPAAESGRGLHVVHALSDHWGWSAHSEHGKAVWAILLRG